LPGEHEGDGLNARFEDLSHLKNHNIDPECKGAGGGYGFWEEGELFIVVDNQEPIEKQRLITVHEVLDGHLRREIKHSRVDRISIDIIDALIQLRLV
jgi:hypothetical protein